MNKPSALVLLSGGMDSTTLLYYVIKELKYSNVATIGFDYGQKHKKELKYAKNIADNLSVNFNILEINFNQFKSNSPLISNNEIPDENKDSQFLTVVPGRNSIFLSMATIYAQINGYRDIFIGANKEDFKSYLDCRENFIKLISNALSTGNDINGIYAPFVNMNKREIVIIGKKLYVPFHLTWSCYNGEDEPCNKCDACIEKNRSLYE